MKEEQKDQQISNQTLQKDDNEREQDEDQDVVVEDMLFGEIEFEHKEFTIERLSHSKKKQQQYQQHLEKHSDKQFLQNKWKERRERVTKRLDGLSKSEKTQENQKRQEQKQQERDNQLKGYESGIPLIIDNSFEQYMIFREVRSLAVQILLTIEAQRKNKNPFQINVCNASEKLKSCMQSQQFKCLPLNVYSEDILEVERFKEKAENMVYLSPDSENELTTVDNSGKTIYIVGGLIDRSVKKWASFDRANSLKIQTARLPINNYLTDVTRRCLNIDTVTLLMGLAVHLNFDWKTATLTVLGNRKIKEELKEEQKDIVLSQKEQLDLTKLDKNSSVFDVIKSIESREKKQNQKGDKKSTQLHGNDNLQEGNENQELTLNEEQQIQQIDQIQIIDS